jgi:Transposase DDE domain
MRPQDLLLIVFCLVDDELQALGPPRSRGPAPILADSEVVTIEVVGELWGLGDDRALFRFFRDRHAAEFPALLRVHRTTFARQAANLCWVKRRVQARLASRLCDPGAPWLVDSAPLPACRFRRARRCSRFGEAAGWGYDPVAQKAFYGLRLHLRTTPEGVVTAYQLAPADAAETEVIWELARRPLGVAIGDRNYWSPATCAAFEACGGRLLAPYKMARYDKDRPRSRQLQRARRRIEPVLGQLIDRFGCRRVRVMDLWHLEHRVVRKILSHTVCAWINVKDGYPPLQLDRLVA